MHFLLGKILPVTFFLFIILMPFHALADDVPGSEDHPLITRYPGSVIYAYESREFDEYVLPVAPLDGGLYDARLTETLLLEGKVTQIQYRVDNRSTLEVYRNYESALKDAGFDFLLEKQGRSFQDVYRFVRTFYDEYSGTRAASSANPSFGGSEFRYLAAKMKHPEGDVYFSLYVTTRGSRTTTQLDVIETVPMDVGLVSVDAEYLRSELERTGFVAIYGIYFEIDASEMTEESRPVMDQIALLLGENQRFDFYIVGHTDNTGAHDYNMNLSLRRAESVVRELVEGYGIADGRLHAIGVGPVAPVATNSTEEGRTLNRRVELVIK